MEIRRDKYKETATLNNSYLIEATTINPKMIVLFDKNNSSVKYDLPTAVLIYNQLHKFIKGEINGNS